MENSILIGIYMLTFPTTYSNLLNMHFYTLNERTLNKNLLSAHQNHQDKVKDCVNFYMFMINKAKIQKPVKENKNKRKGLIFLRANIIASEAIYIASL